MPSSKKEIYLICARKKGQPKKHITVCHRCRWRNNCKPYQKYRQPGLPLDHSPEKRETAPTVPPNQPQLKKTPASPTPVSSPVTLADAMDLLDTLKKELKGIRDLCG
jgi:hypothetical protein